MLVRKLLLVADGYDMAMIIISTMVGTSAYLIEFIMKYLPT